MYAAFDDPYCYPGTTVLRNKLNLRNEAALEAFESEITMARAAEPLPNGRLGATHYRAIHHHLFQDVYDWAGRYRNVRIAKGGNSFCFPEYIAPEMVRLFAGLRDGRFFRGLDIADFAAASANFLSTLNQIHPFREGNGRTQLSFLATLSSQAGHDLDFDRLDPDAMLAAMIASFHDYTGPLRALIVHMAKA